MPEGTRERMVTLAILVVAAFSLYVATLLRFAVM